MNLRVLLRRRLAPPPPPPIASSSHFSPTHLPDFPLLPLSFTKTFSTSQTLNTTKNNNTEPDPIAVSLSTELLKAEDQQHQVDPTIPQRLHLHFSHLTDSITPSIVHQTLNLSADAGRKVIAFNDWLVKDANFKHDDDTLSFFIDYFGRRKDFKATHDLLVGGKCVAGAKCFEAMVDRLARAGRPGQVVSFFERIERDYGFKRDRDGLRLVVQKLCDNGHAREAEKMVKNLASDIFPDEVICDYLIKGWCVDGKLEEAKRLAGEMYRGGFEIGSVAFNAILDCVCKLCREKDPFKLDSEVEKVLVEMDTRGVPRNVETFNVLIGNLCKIRRREDAMKLFHRMGEWGCYPDDTTFIVLIKSLYQGARMGEGDEMIDRMKSAGYGDKLTKKVYFGFLKILCGIERLEHALSVFEKMKVDGCKPGVKTYDLLMGKWCAHNRLDKANALFKEAVDDGVPVTPKDYKVDPRYLPNPKEVKRKGKKRLTLPEKTVLKRRRLGQIRLSFVKKPKKMMRRGI